MMKIDDFTTKNAPKINELDLMNAASVIGCSKEVIKAVVAVEAGGSGFNKDGTIS